MSPTPTASVRYEGFLANTGESTPSHLAHPSILSCGENSERRGPRSPDAFKDDLWWKFGPIDSKGKSDSKAALFCSAGFDWNRSAAAELQCMH